MELIKRIQTLENLVDLEYMNYSQYDEHVQNSVLPYFVIWNNFNNEHQYGLKQHFKNKYDAISAKLW